MTSVKTYFRMVPAVMSAVALVVTWSASFASEVDAAAILKCQALRDDAARLACYDSLNSVPAPAAEPTAADRSPGKAPPAQSPPASPGTAELPAASGSEEPPAADPAQSSSAVPAIAEQPTAAEPAPLDDEIGQETLRGSARKDKPIVRGRVVSCKEDATGKYLFYFDNGQIWRQKDNTNVRWRECAFDVTISKDVFGYRMVPDNEKKRVRIARVK